MFHSPDGSPETTLNVKFVQDTSKFWYKADISRDQGKEDAVNVCFRVNLSIFRPPNGGS